MRILVTGGAGYIGSTTTDHLLQAGHEVIVLDNLSKGYIQAVPSKAEFIQGDIADVDLVSKIFESNIDAVIHFAAFIEAGESMQDPQKYWENNTEKSKLLIKNAVNHRINNFVFSSTAAVYKSKDDLIGEMDEIKPANVYGDTKRKIEEEMERAANEEGLNVCVLRYFNAAGASLLESPPVRGETHTPETHLIPNILQVAMGEKESFTLFGDDYPTLDGTCVRDYIHVDDLATAHILALNALVDGQFSFDVFNLGNGSGYTNLEVLEAARKVTGRKVPMQFGSRREGDAARLVANSSKAKEDLDWQPQYPDIETIVESAWQWHKNHPDGYEENQ